MRLGLPWDLRLSVAACKAANLCIMSSRACVLLRPQVSAPADWVSRVRFPNTEADSAGGECPDRRIS